MMTTQENAVNPIKKIRESLGLNKFDYCRLFNISLFTLTLYERGMQSNLKKIKPALIDNNYNYEEIEAEYQKFRQMKLNDIKSLVNKL